jgi:hypothetical protein
MKTAASEFSDKASRKNKFETVFVVIRDELIDHFEAQGMPNDAVEWYRRVSPCDGWLVGLKSIPSLRS